MLNQPLFQVTLPILIGFVATIWVTAWMQNKRFDDLRSDIKEGFKDIKEKLDKIDKRLEKLEERVTNLEVAKWR